MTAKPMTPEEAARAERERIEELRKPAFQSGDDLDEALDGWERASDERDRAIAEAAVLREAVKHALAYPDLPELTVGKLAAAPLAAAAARVIACAEAWVDSPTMESSSEAQLEAAVDALRAAREGKP